MLERVCGLLERSPEDLAMVQTYYSVIIADEVQDFTPLMWKLLKLFTNNGTPLVCIGDEDQNIYRFKGADVMELLNFSSEFEDGHVYTLNQNRRCRKAILDEALAVIEENTLRFERKRGTWIRSKSSPESTVVMAGFDDFDGDFDDESAVYSELEIHESSMTTSAEMDTSDNFGVLEASLDRNNAVSAESHSESTEFDSAIDSVLAAGSTTEACSANPIVLETKESTKSETEQSNVSGMKHSNYLANIIDSFA